jgi:hypothetical protein
MRRSLAALSLLLAGCGGAPHQPDRIPGKFDTEILDNGTKLFTYTLGTPSPDRRANSGIMPPPGTRIDLPDPHKPLRLLLERNRYCRDGYLTLDQYRMGMQQVIRGECRDAATVEDRQRFGR